MTEQKDKHTPGPWATAGMPATPDTAHWPVGGYAADGRPVLIATCYPIGDDGQPGGECAANARLIAAAPTLLHAIIERSESGNDDDHFGEGWEPLFHEIRDVLGQKGE